MTSSSADSPPVPADSSDPQRAKQIAEASPEGVPANPDAGPKVIGLMLAGIVVLLLVVAVVVAAFASPGVGLAIGGLGLLLFVANPAVWASVLRAKERAEIEG